MSDMRDPRLDPSHPDYRNPKASFEQDGMNWSWILGGIGALVVLLLALSYWSGGDRQTAGDIVTTPPVTTGQSAPRATPPATTGQGSMRPAPAPVSPPPASSSQ